MLVLSRKIGQQILMAKGAVQIKLLRMEGDFILIGVKAPEHIDIDREELYLKKLQQGKTCPSFVKGAL